MKTVSGTVLSSKPVSLSKAASILAEFVSAETGASQAVCAYLRRASHSFNELSQLHKKVKPQRSKHKSPKWEKRGKDLTRSGVSSQAESTQELSHGIVKDNGGESGEKKNKKKRGEIEYVEGNKGTLGIEKDVNLEVEIEMKKEKKQKNKKKSKMESEENGDVGMVEDEEKKHKKKRDLGSEDGGGNVVEDKQVKLKKRKSEEIEDGVEINSDGLHKRKKKKSKSER